MEGLIEKQVTPLLKCLFLLVFIFTVQVLTSHPMDEHDHKEGHHDKPRYVRTFIKYHHRRTTERNAVDEWPLHDNEKKLHKREINYESSTKNTGNSLATTKVNSYLKYKVKAAKIVTDPPTTIGPRISCLYKTHSVSLSVTPAYEDEKNIQQVVENDDFEAPGQLSETTINGETVQVEQCTDSRATCYTLWHQDNDGNVTVLGQGCWRSSQNTGAYSCDLCTQVTPKLPATKFCCCTKNYCNADFMSLADYVATPKAELTRGNHPHVHYSQILASCIVGVLAIMVLGFVLSTLYCKKQKKDISDAAPLDHVEILGDSDTLATGLLCVDNLALVEHIGQGKFGSVWRGRLGCTPVAVKLYSNATTWQKEAAIYSMPYLTHPNILKYYGSDTRPSLTDGGFRHLIVVELCQTTLRNRLIDRPITWLEFADLAHGIASALASLHSQGPNKPCIVHRDVNSNNILISWDGSPKLADLGLAQVVHCRSVQPAPRRITEAGTLRYLAPEALEGALDLSGARAALCAVDVYALGLVLWELLWRTNGAHSTPTPGYTPPYQLLGLETPTLSQLQNLVSRNKMRPPLPRGPVLDPRPLKVASDTCDECWDHDAEARLTAVCVEERMSELKQMLATPGPVIHDNLHPNSESTNGFLPQETEKTVNCLKTPNNNCDINTPLLFTQAHIGRNVCVERNTHTNTQGHTVELIQKSLKDIKDKRKKLDKFKNHDDTCFSVARISPTRIYDRSDRNDIRQYPKPIDFVPNDVNTIEIDKAPKQTNLIQDVKVEKPKWAIRRFFERKLQRSPKPLETEVTLIPENLNGAIKTTVISEKVSNLNYRPSNLVLTDDSFFEGPCTLSPPNRTLSPTMLIESEINKSEKVFGFKELPREENGGRNQIFAVIVPKINTDFRDGVVELHRTNSSDSMHKEIKRNSSLSLYKSANNSESDDSTFKKHSNTKLITNVSNSARSSRASINLELLYMNEQNFDLNSDCSSSEDEHLFLLSENDGSKITMQTVPKPENDRRKNDVLKESSQKSDYLFNKPKYTNFDNEYSDPNDKENTYYGDNPLYLAAINGDLKFKIEAQSSPKRLKSLSRQHSMEQVSELFASSGDIHLRNPAGRVKTPGDLPVAIRKARRDRAMQKGRASDSNRLSLYDDRMMFGNSL